MKKKNIVVEVSRFDKLEPVFKALQKTGAFVTFTKDMDGDTILLTLPNGSILQLTQP